MVAQLGARMHYAVPRQLAAAGLLSRLYTDITGVKGWPRLLHSVPKSLQPPGLRRLLGRIPDGVPTSRITSFVAFGLGYYRKQSAAKTLDETIDVHVWAGQEFGRLVLEHGFGDASGVYTFNSAGLEILNEARKGSLVGITEQTIAPFEFERDILQEEYERYAGWVTDTIDYAAAADRLVEREQSEWDVADVILCGSEFVLDTIRAYGGPVDKCIVVPYGVNLAKFGVSNRPNHRGPLRVLTVGTVGLRKGSPYVAQAAQLLGNAATFRMIGPVDLSEEGVRTVREAGVDVLGRVARRDAPAQFAWADVFLLPSLCEGSATATYEALAAGLPVVCTTNTGSIVRDGVEGFVVPIRDGASIAEKIEMLCDSQLRSVMAEAARRMSRSGSEEAYGQRLVSVLAAKLQ